MTPRHLQLDLELLSWFVGTMVAALGAAAFIVLIRLLQCLCDTSRVWRVITWLAIVFLIMVAGWYIGRAIFGGH